MENLLERMAADATEDAVAQPEEGTSRLARLGEELVQAKATLDDLTERRKQAQEHYDDLRKNVIPEEMAAMGLKGSFTLASGERLTSTTRTFANVKAADRGKFHEWLRSIGAADLIKESVNAQTLSAFARERMEEGEDLPPEVQVYSETTVSITKAR